MSNLIPIKRGTSPRRKVRARGRREIKLPKGLKENPIFRFPKKEPCFCGSGKRFKNCCRDKQPKYITDKEAASIEVALKKVGI